MANAGGSNGNTARVMLVIGKTGTGKSATCNTVVDTDEFEEGIGGLSMTVGCQSVEKQVRGRTLTMIDTPGTMDVSDKPRALEELTSAIDLCPEGIDAFLLTFRCDVRATEEEITAAEEAVELFGEEAYKRAILVFTRSGEYKNDETRFTNALHRTRGAIPRFDTLLAKLKNRWVMMDNSEDCDRSVRERQVSALLSMVDKVAKHNPRRYKTEDQQKRWEQFAQIQMQLKAALQNNMHWHMMKLFAAAELQKREYALMQSHGHELAQSGVYELARQQMQQMQQMRQMQAENEKLRREMNDKGGCILQ